MVHLFDAAPQARGMRLFTSATLPEEDESSSVATASGAGSGEHGPLVMLPLWIRKYLPAGTATFGSGKGTWLEKLPVADAYCTDQLLIEMALPVGLNSSMKS